MSSSDKNTGNEAEQASVARVQATRSQAVGDQSARSQASPTGIGGRILSSIYPGIATLRAENRQLRTEIERVEYLAVTDPLTGLANRRGWDMQLARELSRARRMRRPLCLAMIDIDNFKAFNDTYGHLAADRLLMEIASSWRSRIRDIDLLCRWGGDEFGVLLPDCELPSASEIVGRLQTRMPGGQSCTAAAVCWDEQESSEHLTERADRQLYLEKQHHLLRRNY